MIQERGGKGRGRTHTSTMSFKGLKLGSEGSRKNHKTPGLTTSRTQPTNDANSIMYANPTPQWI